MIYYIKGDATEPIRYDTRFIVHNCNNIGFWGAGFTKAISNKWVLPEIEYRRWYKKYVNENIRVLPLGSIQVVPVSEALPKTYVVNLIGQNGVHHASMNPRPIVYEAIREGLEKLYQILDLKHKKPECSFHMPKIGSGLAKGKWETIESIINEIIPDMDVYVYEKE